MNVETMSTDKLLEMLAWVADRRRYRTACCIDDGAGYAADCAAETRCNKELQKRGYFDWRA